MPGTASYTMQGLITRCPWRKTETTMKKHTLIAHTLDTEFKWEVEADFGSELVKAATLQGLQKWITDASSTAKPTKEQALDPAYSMDKESAEYKAFMQPIRMKAVRIRFGKIKDGTYKPGHGGGSGARSTPEDTAWIAYFNMLDHKEGGKPVIKKTLRRAQEWACRQWLLEQFDPGSAERQDVETNMAEHVRARFDEFIEHEQTANRTLAMGIEYHKMMSAHIGMAK